MPQWLRLTLLAFTVLGILGLIVFTFVRAFQKSEDPTRLAVKWFVTLLLGVGMYFLAKGTVRSVGGAFLIPLAAVFLGVFLSFVWAPNLGHFLFSPILSAIDGGHQEPDPVPLYSTAEALRKRGKYREAIYAIQEQLQNFPKDFAGQMMIAEIQAENLNDMQAAETIVHRLCDQGCHPAANIAFALNTLADWHLKYSQDAEAARRALEKVAALLPNSEFERVAGNRIAHLATTEQLTHAREPGTVKLKAGVEYLGTLKSQAHLLPQEKDPKQEARELVAHLDAHPLDHEARERLAINYARAYGRLDFATEQLEQLIALPNESPKHVARWLNLLADLQVEMTGKTDLAAATLRRIADRFPNHSLAQMAEMRISSLGLELRRYETNRVVKFSGTTGA